MREKTNDLKWIGSKYGRLTVVDFVHKAPKWYWKCVCDCGGIVIAQPCVIKSGHTASCGCLQRENAKVSNLKHGQSTTRLYRIYNGMKNRCYNEKQDNYSNYGGRGVSICEEWIKSFDNFYTWSLSNGYADNLSIDRIDNSKNYSPDNCRWVSRLAQNENTRRNNLLTIDGKTQPLSAWAREKGINYHTLSFRIHQKGLTPEEALQVEE